MKCNECTIGYCDSKHWKLRKLSMWVIVHF